MSMLALKDVGLRGIVFQESFGPDPSLATDNFKSLKTKVAQLRGVANEASKSRGVASCAIHGLRTTAGVDC